MKLIQIDEYIENQDKPLSGPLHRTKVPDSLVDQLKERFFELFSQCGLVEEVARQMGLSPGTFYHWRRNDPAFAQEWDRIRREELLAIVEDKAFEKVMRGESKNDGLHMFLLKSWKREVYDDKFVQDKKPINNFNLTITDARQDFEKQKALEAKVVDVVPLQHEEAKDDEEG